MAKTAVTDWDATAANNTDIDSIDIDEGCAPSGINNAIREIMSQVATAMTTGSLAGIGHLAKATTYTVLEADRGKVIDCSAALTLNLTAAATMQAGWMCYVKADGGAVTIDPNGAEQIEGTTTATVVDGSTVVLYTDGSAWYLTTAAVELLDEDTLSSDSATRPPSQQSVKAYVDNIVDAIYPVGSIYISTNSANPSTIFSGTTWAAYAEGRAIVGVGSNGESTWTAAQESGSETHTLTEAELPSHDHGSGSLATSSAGSHNHSVYFDNAALTGGNGNTVSTSPGDGTRNTSTDGAHTHTISGSTGNAGSGNAHNNIQPSIGVYIFERTA
jgi:microcystin-dependent protein